VWMAGIAEDWERYTTRDRILLCSSILPLFVSVIYASYYAPIIGRFLWFYSEFGYNLFSNEGIFSIVDYTEGCSGWECPRIYYIINPFWLLLSTISIGIYGFYLFRTASSTSPSALFRTSFILTFTAASQIAIVIFSLVFKYGELEGFFRGINWSSGDPPINPLTYLYLPNLIAIVALAYYSRIKNEEENTDYIESEEKSLTVANVGTDSEGQSPVLQSHIFLLVTALGGMFGLDKAYRGDYLLAILKFITLGGLWIWQLYDLYVAAGFAGKSWDSENSGNGRITEPHIALWIAASPLGFIGVDRAYNGDALSGVFKMLTLGGLGLWWLADAYVAAKKAGSAW